MSFPAFEDRYAPQEMFVTTKLTTNASKDEARFAPCFIMKTLFFQAHLRAFNTTTLGPLAEDLTPVAGTEFTASAVPHVSMVTHRTLVQAASLGGGTFITALTSTLHFGVTLQRSSAVSLGSVFTYRRWERRNAN